MVSLFLEAPNRNKVSLKELSQKLANLNPENFKREKKPLSLKRMYCIDSYLISPVIGLLFFVFIMTVLFQAIFTWSAPFMDGIETLLAFAAETTGATLKNTYLKSFFVQRKIRI